MDAADRSQIQAMIDATVHEAVNRAVRDRIVPGFVISTAGAVCSVEPDDNTGTTIDGTCLAAGIATGNRVLLWFPSAGGVYVLGPIPI